MKKLFKGAIPTIALLLVAVMSLSSLTYAWFTAGDIATVDTIDVDVKSVDGLLVSANGYNGTWGSSLTPTGLTTRALRDASTIGTLGGTEGSAQDPIFYNVTYNNVFDAITKSEAVVQEPTTDSYANWIQFPIFIKNEGEDTVNVNLSGTTITGSALSRAVTRIAFVKQGTASATAVVNDNTKPNITYKAEFLGIWEPNATEHSNDGQTWLKNNGQTANTSAKADYKGVNGEVASVADTYVNVATGETFAIITGTKTLSAIKGTVPAKAADARQYYDASCLPNDGEYYVYTVATTTDEGEHFTRLTLDSFFKSLSYTQAFGDDGIHAKANTVYKKVGSTYELLTAFDEISGTESYYQIATVGNAASNVKLYTRDKYVASDVITLVNKGEGDAVVYTAESIDGTYYLFKYDATSECYVALTLDKFFTEIAEGDFDAYSGDVYEKSGEGATLAYTKLSAKPGEYVAGKYYKLNVVGGTADGAVKAYELKEDSILQSVETKDLDTEDYVLQIAGNTIVELTCYIWVEGQDCDCSNYVAGKPFTVNFVFNKVKATA